MKVVRSMMLGAALLMSMDSATALAGAQAPTVRELGAPTANFAEPFSEIRGVRELRDGRLIVVDAREGSVVAIDFNAGTAKPLSRRGRGPGEYTLPFGLFALPGDTSLVLDMRAHSVVVLVGDSAVPKVMRLSPKDGETQLIHQRNDAFDSEGRIHRLVRLERLVDGRRMPADSGAIERVDRATGRRDTLGKVYLKVQSELVRPAPPRPANLPPNMEIATEMPPFASADQWALASDGRAALVTVFPYRVTFVDPRGGRTVGPAIESEALRVTVQQKEAYRIKAQEPVATLRYERQGVITPTFTKPRFTEPSAWPQVLPPFLFDAVTFTPDGMLWVQRTTEPGSPPRYDVIDRTGHVAYQLRLPPRTKLVGFGPAAVYLVRVDDDDLQYLHRYKLPR